VSGIREKELPSYRMRKLFIGYRGKKNHTEALTQVTPQMLHWERGIFVNSDEGILEKCGKRKERFKANGSKS